MPTIWLIRHAESTSNAGEPTEHPALIPLSAVGREQAAALARHIPRRPDRIIVSRYVRTRETAKPLVDRFPDTPIEEWEIHELTYLEPERYRGTTEAQRAEPGVRYWREASPTYRDGPAAESYVEFLHRIRTALQGFRQMREEFTIVFAHGYVIKAMLWEILTASTLNPEESKRAFGDFHRILPVPNATVFPVHIDDTGSPHVGSPWLVP